MQILNAAPPRCRTAAYFPESTNFFQEKTPFGKNSVEKYLENMKDMNKDGKSYAFKTTYIIVRSVLFLYNMVMVLTF